MNPEKEVLDPNPPRQRGIRVVDLSRTPLHEGSTDALQRRILEALRRDEAGILSQDELLESAEGRSPSEVELALRDLSLRGLVRVLWRAPFRFMAFLNEPGPEHPALITAPTGAIPG